MIRVAGRSRFPIPEALYPRALGRIGLPSLPRGALTHIKFPIIIDSSTFRDATGFEHEFDEVQVMEAFRWA